MNFNNKVILITGASTGIGRELAIQLSKKNVKLALVARRENLLQDLTNENVISVKCDVSKKNEVVSAYQQIIEKFGKIDVAILNAGYSVRMKVEEYNSEYAEKIFGANVFGIIYWVEQLIPDMMKRKEGMIVGVSSLADSKGYSKSGFYSASKAAATTYLEGLRSELRKYNVQVLTVRPGFVKTPMTDKNEFYMPLMMSTEKAAQIIINGIEKEKRMIQFPWQLVFATRLIPLIPNRLYELLENQTMKKYE
ncbi:MAG: SDR family NAD(P)-dependent oxidoreductase [Ignavibacteriales bacterium]|nr:SDR family NAD(P)-dependent oxidoreductase [Ignavibacteriales bacterium]MCB9258200.1 SDR family NAD(P)-dependent oxidoreductase [Ignavibacteriales bacterium]